MYSLMIYVKRKMDGGGEGYNNNNNNSEHTPVSTCYLMNLCGSLLYIQSSLCQQVLVADRAAFQNTH